MKLKYHRVLLKLSGEALTGTQKNGFDISVLETYARQIKEILDMGVQMGIVVGGGNIFRGISGQKKGFDRITGDYMGMLATVINGLALKEFIEQAGGKARVLTATEMQPVAERYSKTLAEELLQQGNVLIFTFGTGNPFFTTDTAAALRAVEIHADILLKGTRVDGVYTADPERYPDAVKYAAISFEKAYQEGLQIMDLTAFTMCRENSLPILVFDMNKEGNLMDIMRGAKVGTLIHGD
ncbi:MAG: UMP kinase [Bacteroidales bacterium]|nr:UMP kinase [Bacteroidales bacterium]